MRLRISVIGHARPSVRRSDRPTRPLINDDEEVASYEPLRSCFMFMLLLTRNNICFFLDEATWSCPSVRAAGRTNGQTNERTDEQIDGPTDERDRLQR